MVDAVVRDGASSAGVDRVAGDQRRRIVWNKVMAASYAVDTAFLALFAIAGAISGSVALGYGVGAAAVSAGAHIATASGLNLKAKDPSLVEPLVIYAIALQLGVVLAAPQIAFPFLANLFTVFAFGMIWLTLRDSIVVWTLGIAGTAAVFYVAQARIGIPIASDFQLTLVWLYFSLILGRCLLLSVTANRMRAQLASGRRKLAESLVQVEILASRDELTGALNRRSLMAALERERAHAERSGVSLSVAMIDLDHFKRVNDTYGHAAGDEVLRTLAATVHETMRTTDVFGRYGGEEFMMILVGSAPELALGAMERIRNVLAAKTWPTIAPEFSVTLSAGIACHRKGESGEALLHRADKALYQAKDAGRNTIITSSP